MKREIIIPKYTQMFFNGVEYNFESKDWNENLIEILEQLDGEVYEEVLGDSEDTGFYKDIEIL